MDIWYFFVDIAPVITIISLIFAVLVFIIQIKIRKTISNSEIERQEYARNTLFNEFTTFDNDFSSYIKFLSRHTEVSERENMKDTIDYKYQRLEKSKNNIFTLLIAYVNNLPIASRENIMSMIDEYMFEILYYNRYHLYSEDIVASRTELERLKNYNENATIQFRAILEVDDV